MLAAVINHLWQSTLFAGGVGIAALTLRRNGAAIRFTLWFAASVKFLVPFALLAALGSHIPRLAADSGARATGTPVLSAVIDQIVAPMSAAGHVISTTSAIASSGHFLLKFLIMAWAGGVLVVAVQWFVGWRRVQRALIASEPVAMDFLIPARTSRLMQGPAVAGIVRPILLVPAGFEDWLSENQLRAVLAHERCHVRRRDNLTAALHRVVEALFWFHPLVWWLETRLIAERERACDEAVLAGGVKSKDYAEGLLRVCQNYLALPPRCAAGVGGGDLTRRILFILNPPRHVRLSALQAILLTTMAGAVFAEPIVSGHLAAPLAPGTDADSAMFKNYVAVVPADAGPSDARALLNTAGTGSAGQVRKLLHKGVDVEYTDGAVTALTQAAQAGNEPVVRELLANGAQVEHSRSGGETALMLAAGGGHVAVVETLLNSGAQINDQTGTGATALMAASANGRQAVVRLLLGQGADVNRETSTHERAPGGETALLLAARGGYDTIVRLLLDFGADSRHRQFDGETALDLAVQGRKVAVVETLLQRGAGAKP